MPLSGNRFKFGIAISIAWIVLAVSLLIALKDQALAMKPNEWGDFLAGTCAPLAFLWLVLGYLQQGEELKQSTKALLMQAEELKNSVQHQQALVEVSRQQLEGEREALMYERTMREESAKPNIKIMTNGGAFRGDGFSTYNVTFSNSGNTATDLLAELNLNGSNIRLLELPSFNRGEQRQSAFTSPTPLRGKDTTLQLSYKDTLGRSFLRTFAIWRETEHPHSNLLVSELISQI